MPARTSAVCALSLLVLPGGCVPDDVTTSAARNRTAPATARLDASDAERFGYAEAKRSQTRPVSEERLSWRAPEQWTAKGPASMRLESFAVQDHPDLDCFVSQLGAGAGGLLLNVNRWRQQVGLSPISAAEASALPRFPALGVQAKLIELESPDTERGMAVFAAFLQDRSVFVKMLGPAASVAAERDRFRAFCKTLEVKR